MKLTPVCLLGLALLTAGCATTRTTQTTSTETTTTETLEVAAMDPAPDDGQVVYAHTEVTVEVPVELIPAQLNSVEFLDACLYKDLAVQKTGYRRTSNSTMEVITTLKNLTCHRMKLKARTQFFNGDRENLEGPVAWQQVFIPPYGIETYRSYSATPADDAHYYVEVAKLYQ